MLSFEEQPADSPFVERPWHCHSASAGSFTSIAAIHWELVVTRFAGRTTLTLHGPETKATWHEYPAGVEWFGIDFTLGTYLLQFPPKNLVDLRDATLPCVTHESFVLQDSEWSVPTADTVESFVEQLVRAGLLVHDPVVSTLSHGQSHALSLRAVQNRFVRATGLTPKTIAQIKRARHAVALLQRGVGVADTAHAAGYYDQPHLTRSLKRFIGGTPRQTRDLQLIGLRPSE